jgi:hypothetical protein
LRPTQQLDLEPRPEVVVGLEVGEQVGDAWVAFRQVADNPSPLLGVAAR